MLNALFLCDDTGTIVRLSDVFRESGFTVTAVETLEQARAAMLREPPDVALMDSELLGDKGLDFLQTSRLGNLIEILLITPDAKLREAVRGMQAGASDYLEKPVDKDKLRKFLKRVSTTFTEPELEDSGILKVGGLGIMHGDSPPMRRLFKMLRKVSATGMTVLLVGESGVGKELAAEIIHKLSDRANGPLVPVNCGAISPEILESELFGHEKGSFTGATQRHIGFFERSKGGTLFLDEITEMSPDLQVRLLRVLETGKLRRVGGEKQISVNVRVVAATNRDPEEALEGGALREDLYYRLSQFPIRVPALRERGDDVVILAEKFLAELGEEHGVEKRFSEDALEALRVHTWPGNVRELKNAIGRGYVLAGTEVQRDDLPPSVLDGQPMDADYLRIAVGMPLAEVERRAILATVEHLDGDKKAAAKSLGISLKTLYTKLKKYRGD